MFEKIIEFFSLFKKSEKNHSANNVHVVINSPSENTDTSKPNIVTESIEISPIVEDDEEINHTGDAAHPVIEDDIADWASELLASKEKGDEIFIEYKGEKREL